MGKSLKSCPWCLFLPRITENLQTLQSCGGGEDFRGRVGGVLQKQCHRATNWGDPTCLNSHSEKPRNKKHTQKLVLTTTCSSRHPFATLNTNSWSYKSLKNRWTGWFPKPRLSLGFARSVLLCFVDLHCFLPFLLVVSLHPLRILLFVKTEPED